MEEKKRNPDQDVVTLNELYIDAARLTSGPYTVRMMVGRDENGTFNPQLVLAVSPQFALQLHQALGAALDHYRKTYTEIQLPQTSREGNPE